MKILFVTPQLPYPPDKGTTIRNFALIKGLARRGHEIHLLSFIRSEEDLAWLAELEPHCRKIVTVMAPHRSRLTRLRKFLFSQQPDMAGRLPSEEFHGKLASLLSHEHYDVVQIEGIEVAQYALAAGELQAQKANNHAPLLVFDDHNAEYILQKRAYEIDRRAPSHWGKAFYSWIQWRRLRAYERSVCLAADRVLAVSEADAAAIRRLDAAINVAVIANGVDCAFFHSMRPEDHPVPSQIRHVAALAFTGTMDFRPNIDAMLWFCQDILPLIKKHLYHVHLYVVGKSPPRAVRDLAGPAVTVTGYVSDIRPYIAHSSIYVVPMRIGSGTKLKVLQAMAMGIPVVATTVGAEGIDAVGGQHLVVADTPDEFAHGVLSLLEDAARRRQLAAEARQLVETKYDWDSITPVLESVYREARIPQT